MAAAAILKIKNRHTSATVSAIGTKFGTVTQFGPLELFNHYNFEISNIQDGAATILKNRKIAIP